MQSYQVHVACHELLGHGVGKLLHRKPDGSITKVIDPLTGEPLGTCYEEGETWNTKFKPISTSYEECRADTCGFYLETLPEVYRLFGVQDEEVKDMFWTNIMNHFRKGILCLDLYNPQTNKWGQAHVQGAYVLSQFILQNQKSEIAKVEFTEDSFLIHLDKELLFTEGRDLIKFMLTILQAYKSSGAVEKAKEFYAKYSAVDEKMLKVRDLIQKANTPGRLLLNNNLVYYNEDNIEVREYPQCFEGIIMSF